MKVHAVMAPAAAGLLVAFAPGCAMPSSDEYAPVDVAESALSDDEADTPEDQDFFGGNGAARRKCRQLRRQCRRENEASCAEYSQQCLLKIGVVGDSLSDEYQGISSQLPGLQWTEQVHELEHVSLGLFGTRPEPRNDGLVLNWARFGQAANSPQWSELDPAVRAACLGGQDDPRLQTIGSLDAQIDGLGAQIQNFRVDVALVWVGHNDFFIAQCLGQPIDAAFVGALIDRIVGAAVELAQYADAGLGAPRAKVAIIGLAGDAGAINPALSQAAGAAGITFIDPFTTVVTEIVTSQFSTVGMSPPNGFYEVGGVQLVPFTLVFSPAPDAIPRAASLADLSPTGTGPCTSFPLGFEVCSTPAYAEPFQHWDAIHPNTIYMGVVGNQILLDLNAAFGFAIEPLTDAQLLDAAGL